MKGFNFSYDKSSCTSEIVHINKFSLKIKDKVLFEDSLLSLSPGNIYGLIGKNGCGKTTLLKHIATNQFPLNERMMVLYVEQEIEDTDETPVEILLKSNRQMTELKEKLEKIEIKMNKEDVEKKIYQEYGELNEQLNSYNFEQEDALVRKILYGLGFSDQMMKQPGKLFSGGWKMRISLARALYIKPDLLLLDEPTNHLDLEAVIWLGNYLESWQKIALVVSHNVGFLNQVTTHIINIENYKLATYKGDYYMFKKNYRNKQKSMMKKWNKFEKKVKQMKKKQVNKKEIQAFIKKSDISKPEKEYVVNVEFPEIPVFKGNIITMDNVSFSYPDNPIFNKVCFGVAMRSRITLVGKNGSGKSTLLKLIMGEIKPTVSRGISDLECQGYISRTKGLRIGYYHQHFDSNLPLDKTPVEYLLSIVPDELIWNNRMHTVRSYLGRIKLEGNCHTKTMDQLSGGQKARVALVKLMFQRPHLILLDEPTNHLDIETVEALIEGLNNYDGGIMVITHEPELITRLNSQLWVLRDKKIEFYRNTFDNYCTEIVDGIE